MSQVPAARNTLRILALLSSIDVPISASRIRHELGIPKSSTYHLLNEMIDAGFVVYLPELRAYGLGMATYAMAAAYTTQQPLVRLAQKSLESLADVTGGSGHLSRLLGSEVLYLQETRSSGAVSLVTEVGVRLRALGCASGRAMLAYLPEAEVKAVFATSGAGSYRELKQHLERVRERGWEQEVEEVSRGQESLAAPVLDHLDRPAASLAVTFRVGRVKDGERSAVLGLLRESAAQVAEKMYGTR